MLKNAVIAMLSAGVICLLEHDNPIVCKAIWLSMSFVIFSIIIVLEYECKRMIQMFKNWINFKRTVNRKIVLRTPTKAS